MVESSSGCLIFHQLLQLHQLLLQRATRRIKGLHTSRQRHRFRRRTEKPGGKLWRPMGTNGDLTIKKPGVKFEISKFLMKKPGRCAEISHWLPLCCFPGKSLKSLREVPQVHRGRFWSKSVDGLKQKWKGYLLKKSSIIFCFNQKWIFHHGNPMCPCWEIATTPHNQQRSPAATAQCAGTARWDSTAHYLPAQRPQGQAACHDVQDNFQHALKAPT